MTDNEIIKALECCNADDVGSCNDCPLVYNNEDLENCEKRVRKECIELINRQKAEIEKYHHIEQTVKDFWSELKKLSAFKDLQEPTLTELLEYIEQTNAEAIKEFAERLKSKFTHNGKSRKYGDFTCDDIKSYEIDNLVKEMVGEYQ